MWKIFFDSTFLQFIIGLWGEIRQWNDGTTIVQKTHDASKHHVLKVLFLHKLSFNGHRKNQISLNWTQN